MATREPGAHHWDELLDQVQSGAIVRQELAHHDPAHLVRSIRKAGQSRGLRIAVRFSSDAAYVFVRPEES